MPTPTKARNNPFRSERVAAFRYQSDAETFAAWARQLQTAPRYRLSIVGPMGTGKTVLLEDLFQESGPAADWITLRQEDPLRRKLLLALRLFAPTKTPLFVDGLEALPS